MEAFKDLDIAILGISVDDTFGQQTFAESLGLAVPRSSAMPMPKSRTCMGRPSRFRGARTTPMPGKAVKLTQDRIIASQAFFLIDKQGVVRGRWLPGDRKPMAATRCWRWPGAFWQT